MMLGNNSNAFDSAHCSKLPPVEPLSGNHRRGSIVTDPIVLQRIEGGVLLVIALVLYAKHSGPWLLFIVLILAPDLFMAGYLAGPRTGATVYNLGHTWLLPGILAIVGVLGGADLAISVALIWFAHIGVDRLMGYGLKLPTAFQDTHLGRIGRRR
jgi:hypothetical protein